MREKRNEIIKFQGGLPPIRTLHPLARANRTLLWLVCILMVAVLALGYFLVPNFDLATYQKVNQKKLSEIEMNPVVSAEVNALKGQMVGLVSGSIESKLRTLEESVKLGATQDTLGAIADIKNDIKVLRSYSETPKTTQIAVNNEQLLEEVNYLKRLIYLILASAALVFVAVMGVWIKQKRLPYRKFDSFLDKS